MNPQEITEQHLQQLKEAHAEWLQHPITTEMFKVLHRHELAVLDAAINKSEDMSVTEDYFRGKMVGVRTIRAIEKLLRETNKFVENKQ
jgi:uncharacterized protein with von Willebrand factor type A (vWA) domain